MRNAVVTFTDVESLSNGTVSSFKIVTGSSDSNGYVQLGNNTQVTDVHAKFMTQQEFSVAGRLWQVTIAALPEFEKAHQNLETTAIVAVVVLITVFTMIGACTTLHNNHMC